jgi:steroid delta-isomerase-like uncharacterized protein
MFKSNCIIFIFLLLGACSPIDKKKETEARNIKTVQAYVDTIWNNKQLDSLEVYFSSAFLRKVNNIELATDNVELTANINILFSSFPDLQMDIEYLIAATNKVFMNWTISGTNTGDYSDQPATGQKVKISGITRFDLNDEGKITYINLYFNELSLMQQLGYTLTKPQIE